MRTIQKKKAAEHIWPSATFGGGTEWLEGGQDVVRLIFQVAPSDFRGISEVRSEDNGRSVKRSSGSLGDRWRGPEIKPCELG